MVRFGIICLVRENIRCSNSDAVKRPPESDRSFERGPHGVVIYKIEKRA